MNVPSLFVGQQEQLFDAGHQYTAVDLLNSPSGSNSIPTSPVSPFPSKHLTPLKNDMTSVLDFENLLLESSRTYSARSNASLISQESRDWAQLNNRTPTPSGLSPVLTARGVADLTSPQDYRQPGVDAQLANILNLISALQQTGGLASEVQNNNVCYPNGIPSHVEYAHMVANSQNNNVQPIPHQIDLMQQILTNPSGNHLYKTEICRAYDETRKCRFGDRCKYAHGPEELRQLIRGSTYKTKICKSFVEDGYCPYGSRCNFVHKLPGPQVKIEDCLPLSNSVSSNLSSSTGSDSSETLSPPNSSRSSSSNGRLPIFQQLTELGSFD